MTSTPTYNAAPLAGGAGVVGNGLRSDRTHARGDRDALERFPVAATAAAAGPARIARTFATMPTATPCVHAPAGRGTA